jgi:8-oxo-dGTP pyrophosphatase MutT (NUDIX family)
MLVEADAVRRELHEEAGIRVAGTNRVDSIEHRAELAERIINTALSPRNEATGFLIESWVWDAG